MKDMVAYKHHKSLQISAIRNPHPTSTLSVSSVHQSGTTCTCVAAYNSCVHNVTLVPVTCRTSFLSACDVQHTNVTCLCFVYYMRMSSLAGEGLSALDQRMSCLFLQDHLLLVIHLQVSNHPVSLPPLLLNHHVCVTCLTVCAIHEFVFFKQYPLSVFILLFLELFVLVSSLSLLQLLSLCVC